MKTASELACAECGTVFEARSSRAKYCSPKCRKAVSRRPSKQGKLEAEGAPQVPTAPPAPEYDSLADQIKNSLTELEALNTISGMAALRVAQQIDRGRDSGSAVATLTKELSRLVTEAKRESEPKRKDAADAIASKVIAKLQGLTA